MAHHLLGSYQRSLLAILLAQFTKKRFSGGMAGVVRLATESVTVQVYSPAFCHNHSQQLGSPNIHLPMNHPANAYLQLLQYPRLGVHTCKAHGCTPVRTSVLVCWDCRLC